MKYTFTAGKTLQVAGAGDFFRLLSTTSPVKVEFYFQGREIAERDEVEAGFAEQFRTVDFDRVDITSPLAQTVQFEMAKGSEIRYDRGAASISGSVDLNAATLLALEVTSERPEAPTGGYSIASALVANTPVQVFSAASNPNGTIIYAAGCTTDSVTGDPSVTLISKATAPANAHDGFVYMRNEGKAQGSAWQSYSATLTSRVFVPAGHALYWISILATSAGSTRNCIYKQL